MKLTTAKNKVTLPAFKVADTYLDLKTLDTSSTLVYLDEQIKRRELSVEKRIKLA